MSEAPSVTPTVAVVGANNADSGWNKDPNSFVIGASVGGAVCVGLCGLYVLYRRRKAQKTSKGTINKIRSAGRPESADVSPVPPPLPPLHQSSPPPPSAHFDSSRVRSGSFVDSDSTSVRRSSHINDHQHYQHSDLCQSDQLHLSCRSSSPSGNRRRGESFVSQASHFLSSLHTSEQSFHEHNESKVNDDNVGQRAECSAEYTGSVLNESAVIMLADECVHDEYTHSELDASSDELNGSNEYTPSECEYIIQELGAHVQSENINSLSGYNSGGETSVHYTQSMYSQSNDNADIDFYVNN